MTIRQQVMREVRRYDAELFDESDRTITVWTPSGVVWNATGCHVISATYYTDKASAWATLLEDMAEGVGGCELKDCDNCDTAAATATSGAKEVEK